MTTFDPQPVDLNALREALTARLTRFRRQVRSLLALEGLVRLVAVVLALLLLSLLLDYQLHLSLPMRGAFLLISAALAVWAGWEFLAKPLRTPLGLVELAGEVERKGQERGAKGQGEEERANDAMSKLLCLFSPPPRGEVGRGAGARGSFAEPPSQPPPRGRGKKHAHRVHGPPPLALISWPSSSVPPTLASRVATVLQLPDLLAQPASPSPVMVAEAVRRSSAALEGVDFEHYLDQRRRTWHLAILGVLVVLPLIWVASQPATAGLWARRWFLGSRQPWPQRQHLLVAGLADGRIAVPRGEPYVLRVSAAPGSVPPEKVMLRASEQGGAAITAALTRFGAGDFRYDLPPLQQPASVKVWGGDETIEPFTIEPVDRPRIVSLELISQHPTQEKPQVHSFTGGDTEMAFLPRTRLALTLTANVPLASVRVTGNAPEPPAAERLDAKRYVIAWTHEQAVQLQIELTSAQANLTSLPLPIAIGLKIDRPPTLNLAFTGVRARVSPQARIPLTLQAHDDHGLTSVSLAVKTAAPDAADPLSAPEQTIQLYGPAKTATETEFQQAHTLDLATLKPVTGALISLLGKAQDDCFVGAQTGQSRVLSFRVVPSEELFRDILLRLQQERAKFRKALEAAGKVRDMLAQEQAPGPDLARQHRLVQRETARIAAALTESLTEMRLNALGGAEAYDLMEKNVVAPLRRLDVELMVPQRDALDALGERPGPGDKGQGEEAKLVAAVLERQDQIAARMREILKQMAQWDSFVDVLNQLNEIIKLQTQVQERTEQLKEKETQGLFEP